MNLRHANLVLPAAAVASVAVALAQQPPTEPTCEQVYKDIEVFKGVPASDLIPAMEFMSASMQMPCTGCHEPGDYAAPTKGKVDGRRMVLLQRDINAKWFDGRLEVTCMSCHNGQSHPKAYTLPPGVTVSHELADVEVTPEALFDKHLVAVGKAPPVITFAGTLEAPNEISREIETHPLALTHASDGRFRFVAGERKFGFDGKDVWYYGAVMTGEPAAILSRVARSWRGQSAFAGLASPSLDGMEQIGRNNTLIVRATRASSGSLEDLYFERKTGLLVRAVNVKRSSIGNVISSIDYSGFKPLGGVRAPTKIVVTLGTGDQWTMTFKSAKAESTVDDALFRLPEAER